MKAGPVPAAVSQRYIPNIQARLVGITFPLARGGVRDGGASAQGGCRGGQRGPAPAALGDPALRRAPARGSSSTRAALALALADVN